MSESEAPTFDPEGIESLPEDIQADTNDLIWLGYIEDIFEFCGHRFGLRTLYGEEELLAALISKEYMETLGQHKAYAWSLAALALTAVDDDTEFCPQVTADNRAYAKARFQYCTSRWMWPVGSFLYSSYAVLLQRQNDAVEAMQNLSIGSLHTSTPFADSSTDRESSVDLGEEIMSHVTDSEDSTPSNFDSSDS